MNSSLLVITNTIIVKGAKGVLFPAVFAVNIAMYVIRSENFKNAQMDKCN
jgi:hypothetical protein